MKRVFFCAPRPQPLAIIAQRAGLSLGLAEALELFREDLAACRRVP